MKVVISSLDLTNCSSITNIVPLTLWLLRLPVPDIAAAQLHKFLDQVLLHKRQKHPADDCTVSHRWSYPAMGLNPCQKRCGLPAPMQNAFDPTPHHWENENAQISHENLRVFLSANVLNFNERCASRHFLCVNTCKWDTSVDIKNLEV